MKGSDGKPLLYILTGKYMGKVDSSLFREKILKGELKE
jgi:hypothetical protein